MASVDSGADDDDRTQAMIKLQNPLNRELSIRSARPTIPQRIKFDIPTTCREFTPFAHLPAEIRHEIWETSLATPGMQFLRIMWQDTRPPRQWWTLPAFGHVSSPDEDEKEDDPILLEVKHERRFDATLKAYLLPLYPTPRADISYYTILNQELTKLSVTCAESAAVAKRLMSRPNALTLEGRLISLDITSDVVYLEYVPPEIFEIGCRFTMRLECQGLDKIRNVAFRYCHKWVEYPKHLYRFMAQYLPNLENFYFIDYYILRKNMEENDQAADLPESDPEMKPKDRPQPGKFKGGNRTYHEVDDEEWAVASKVYNTMSWLQDRFVRYAKASTLATHKNPERVKFSVLACEWAHEHPSGPRKAFAPLTKKGQNKRAFCDEHTANRNRRSPRAACPPDSENNTPEVGDSFSFVFGDKNQDYDFHFTVPRK